MENNLLQTSVTLAQVFVDNLEGYSHYNKELIGENIIKFLYKWIGSNNDDVEFALSQYSQHNTDCRYECYCCGQCEEIELENNEPNILDDNIQNIIKILRLDAEEDNNSEVENIFAIDDEDE